MLLFVTFIFSLLACAAKAVPIEQNEGNQTIPIPESNNIKQINGSSSESKVSQNQYKGFVLQNGLRVILISNPRIQQAAVYLQIDVGEQNDPPNLIGMFELASKLLVTKDSDGIDIMETFDYHTKTHGGSYWTVVSKELTHVYFDIDTRYLNESLEKFSKLFTKRQFHPKVIRETIVKIANLHKSSTQSDYGRLQALYQVSALTSDSAANKSCLNETILFQTAEKLNFDLNDEVTNFYGKFYTANRMFLVVYGAQDLSELSGMVVQNLAGLSEGGKIEAKSWRPHPYSGPGHSGYEFKTAFKSDSDDNVLDVHFALPDYSDPCSSLIVEYVTKFFYRKRIGSSRLTLLDKRFTLENSNYFVYDSMAGGAGDLLFRIALTREGVSNLDQVLYSIFAYLNYLRTTISVELLDDIARVKNLRNMHETDALEIMFNYYLDFIVGRTVEGVLSDQCGLSSDRMKDKINKIFSQLTPQNAKYIVASQLFANETASTEQCTGAKYTASKISDERINFFSNASLNLSIVALLNAKRPRFVLNSTVRRTISQKYPKMLFEDEKKRLWWIPSDFGALTSFAFKISLPEGYLMAMLEAVLLQEAAEHFAKIKGHFFNFRISERGFVIQTMLNWESLPKFLTKTFEIFASRTNVTVFRNAKEKIVKNFRGYLNREPLIIANGIVRGLLESPSRHYPLVSTEKIDALSIDDFNEFRSTVFSKMFIEAAFYSNDDKWMQEADRIFRKTVESIEEVVHFAPLIPANYHVRRAIKLPKSANILYERALPEGENSAVLICYQIEAADTHHFVLGKLLEYIIKPYCRVQSQINIPSGSIVQCKLEQDHSVSRFCIGVQGKVVDPVLITDQNRTLVTSFQDFLLKIKSESFNGIKNSFLHQFANLIREEQVTFWNNIADGNYFFNKEEEYSNITESLTLDDLISFTKATFSTEQRKLTVYVHPNHSTKNLYEENTFKVIPSLEQFIQDNELYPPEVTHVPINFPF